MLTSIIQSVSATPSYLLNRVIRCTIFLYKAVAVFITALLITCTNQTTTTTPKQHEQNNKDGSTTGPSNSNNSPVNSSPSNSKRRLPPHIGTGILDSSRLETPHIVTYYSTLLVSSTATQNEIKQAHRRLAIRYHPDSCQRNFKGSSANKSAIAHSSLSVSQCREMFEQVQEAYEILSDPVERRRYDYSLMTRTKYKKLPNHIPLDEEQPPSESYSPTSSMSLDSSLHSTRRNSSVHSPASSDSNNNSNYTTNNFSSSFPSRTDSNVSSKHSSRRNSLSNQPTPFWMLLITIFILQPAALIVKSQLMNKYINFLSYCIQQIRTLTFCQLYGKLLSIWIYSLVYLPLLLWYGLIKLMKAWYQMCMTPFSALRNLLRSSSSSKSKHPFINSVPITHNPLFASSTIPLSCSNTPVIDDSILSTSSESSSPSLSLSPVMSHMTINNLPSLSTATTTSSTTSSSSTTSPSSFPFPTVASAPVLHSLSDIDCSDLSEVDDAHVEDEHSGTHATLLLKKDISKKHKKSGMKKSASMPFRDQITTEVEE